MGGRDVRDGVFGGGLLAGSCVAEEEFELVELGDDGAVLEDVVEFFLRGVLVIL
jgi:hypothetical protein